MRQTGKQNRLRAGFTLAELLITLAIVSILLAVAIPGVFAIRKDLRITELDSYAREIFLASQNNLTARLSAGTLEEVAPLSSSDPRWLDATADTESLAALLPSGAIDPGVSEGTYLIRLNLRSGSVLEVYYSANGFTPEQKLAATGEGLDQAARRVAEIGYYVGGDVTRTPIEQLLPATLEILNGNELTAKITVPNAASYAQRKVTLTLRVEALDGSSRRDFPLSYSPVDGAAILVLDSLDPGRRFSDLKTGIAPGAQLRLTAILSSDDASSSYALAESNSLFADRAGDQVTLSCARHLQNLAPEISGMYTGLPSSALQSADIAWPDTYSFTPISCSTLLSFDGCGFTISGLMIDAAPLTAPESLGLFGFILPPDGLRGHFQNIRLVNASITASGRTSAVGLLCGSAVDTDFIDCKVYVDAPGQPKQHPIQGRGAVGGLIGAASDCTFSQCSAGLPVLSATGGDYLGGLAGYAEGSSFDRCYAATDQLTGTTGYAGMFLGWGVNVTVSNSYAVGNLSAQASKMACGFLCGTATASDAYCAVTYMDVDGQYRDGFSPNYAFLPGVRTLRCAYLDMGAGSINPDSQGVEPLSYAALRSWRTGDAWTAAPAGQSVPYQTALFGRGYPFPALSDTLPHYGSWPLPVEEELLLAYWEQYESDGPLHFWFPDGTAATGLPALRPENPAMVYADGYALLSPTELPVPPKVSYPAEIDGQPTVGACSGPELALTGDGRSYFIYRLPAEILSTDYAAPTFWQELTCGTQRFWYNPHFGKAVALDETLPSTPASIRVCSARQLIELGRHPAYWSLAFVQELDIDYTYCSTPFPMPQSSIGTPESAFTGTYDGGNLTIYHLPVPAAYHEPTGQSYAGLFGVIVGGTVQNLALSPASFPQAIYAGALAGRNGGTLINCTVTYVGAFSTEDIESFGGLVGVNQGDIFTSTVLGAGASLTFGGGSAAGFAAENYGTISNCSVRPLAPAYGYHALSLSAEAAYGFVAYNTGFIQYCFSSCTLLAEEEAAGFAGENEFQSGSTASLWTCYTNCLVKSQEEAAGFLLSNHANVGHCYALLSIEAAETAGFFLEAGKEAEFSYCYAASEGSSYGFGPDEEGHFLHCYYLASHGVRPDGAGLPLPYDAMTLDHMGLASSPVWTDQGIAYPYHESLQSKSYPFPQLSGLDHYGDWPQAATPPSMR